MSARRGGRLELAIKRGARHHRHQGRRIVLVRQFPDVATDKDGAAFFSTGAPVDFLGCLDGRGFAVEAKEARGRSLPLTRLRQDQRELMAMLDEAGSDVRLVVWFPELAECYSVTWAQIASFVEAPWRQSWPIAWFRALGLRLPVDHADDDKRRLVRLLDGEPHPQRLEAADEVEHEKSKLRDATPIVAETVGDEDIEDATVPSSPRLSADEWKARIVDATNAGINRQLKRPRRAFKRRTA